MKCSYCGNELKENDAKCSFCGQPVEGAIPTEEGSQALTADMTGEKPAETEPQTGTSAEAFSLPESASELLNGGPIQPKKKSGAKIALIAVAADWDWRICHGEVNGERSQGGSDCGF